MPVNSFEHYPMSWKPVLKKGSEPLYLNLSEKLEQDIHAGILHPGTRLPPQRELADFLDMNVSTVSRAFKICAQKGLISGSVGSGTYVAYDIPASIVVKEQPNHPKPIELGSMLPETIPQEEMISILRKMMAETDFGSFFQYRQDILHWHRDAAEKLMVRIGCPVPGSQILFAGGGQNSLAAIFAGLFQPGERIGTDPLVYPGIKSAAKLFGIQTVPIAQENNEMTEQGIRYAVKNHGIRAIYVMPNCHNPTTHIMTGGCRKMIAGLTKELDLLVIEDGINSLLLDEPEKSIFAYAPEHTIFILSLSKSISPALRLAYLSVPNKYYHDMDNALYNLNLSQSSLLLELASRLVASGQFDSLLRRRKEGLYIRNRLTDQILSGYRVAGNKICLHRWLYLPPGVTGIQFDQLALAHGVSTFGAERFAVGKDAPVGAVRLAICAPDTLDELEQGLMILRDLLQTI